MGRLSRREREIMEIVYAAGAATVKEILGRMVNAPTRPALRSLLGILEQKGELTHSKSGREFVYRPTGSRERVGRSVLDRVVETFFGGSLERAVAAYLGDPQVEPSGEELDELAELIEAARVQRKGKGGVR